MSLSEQMVARIAKLERRMEEVKTKERPLALQGWRDDFFGRSIDVKYEQQIVGAGSGIGLLDTAHGGWIQLLAGAGNGRYARLWLGNAAFNYDTLDADHGWVMMVRVVIMSSVASAILLLGAETTNRVIWMGLDTNTSANWIIRSTDAGGTTNLDTGIAADTGSHWHRLEVFPEDIAGGRQADYYLDGALIGSKTTNMPTEALTPNLMMFTREAVAKTVYIDYLGIIPMNL